MLLIIGFRLKVSKQIGILSQITQLSLCAELMPMATIEHTNNYAQTHWSRAGVLGGFECF